VSSIRTSNPVPRERLAQLAACPQLAVLHTFGVRYDPAGILELPKCENLSVVELKHSGLMGDSLSSLAKIPKLSLIALEGWAINDQDLRRLESCQSLTYVSLAQSHTDLGLQILRESVPKLTRLRMHTNQQVTAAGLQQMQSIIWLCIGPQHLRPDFGAAVEKMPQLQSLELWGLPVGRGGFAPFTTAKPKSVSWLVHGSPNVYPELAEHVRTFLELKHPETLWVTGVPIDDRHVPLFVDAAPGQTIRLYGTRLTSAGIAQIRQQLPQCTIKTDVK
jgi:hypothetical protein